MSAASLFLTERLTPNPWGVLERPWRGCCPLSCSQLLEGSCACGQPLPGQARGLGDKDRDRSDAHGHCDPLVRRGS